MKTTRRRFLTAMAAAPLAVAASATAASRSNVFIGVDVARPGGDHSATVLVESDGHIVDAVDAFQHIELPVDEVLSARPYWDALANLQLCPKYRSRLMYYRYNVVLPLCERLQARRNELFERTLFAPNFHKDGFTSFDQANADFVDFCASRVQINPLTLTLDDLAIALRHNPEGAVPGRLVSEISKFLISNVGAAQEHGRLPFREQRKLNQRNSEYIEMMSLNEPRAKW